MVDALTHYSCWKAKPARRVYIPKTSGKLRPLGIPVVVDRCLQAMVKNALEPSWEVRFEGISYGFRPGRSCHDAIGKIYPVSSATQDQEMGPDADIKGALTTSHTTIFKKPLVRFLGEDSSANGLRQDISNKRCFMRQKRVHHKEA